MPQPIVYGDPGPLESWPPYNGVPYKRMPTAIIRICTTRGIVIAADGLESPAYPATGTKQRQKIYPVQGLPLAYAVFGATGMRLHGNKVIIDLIEEADKSARLLTGSSFDDLALYAEYFSKPIQAKLEAIMQDGSTTTYPCLAEKDEPGHTIAHLFFFGYYRGLASTVDLRFFHRDHVLAEPSKTSVNMEIGHPPWTRGSEKIARALFNSDDKRLAAFRRRFPDDPDALTVEEASEIAANYIRACCSEEGKAIDPDASRTIGGHIHIAKITPDRFEWIRRPISDPLGQHLSK